jgi:glucokinase
MDVHGGTFDVGLSGKLAVRAETERLTGPSYSVQAPSENGEGVKAQMSLVLAGDIGGTKTHLGLYRADGRDLALMRDHIYATHDFPSLEAVLLDFLRDDSKIDVACMGVPGPVIDGVAHTTNVPWDVSRASISKTLNGALTRVLNDLEATAYGMLHLKPSDLVELQKGVTGTGNIAVIAAGTGLGEAALIQGEREWTSVATEGGHCDFAPRGVEQVALLQFLERKFGHASYERALSGPGLYNVYCCLLESSAEPEPSWLSERMREHDASAIISETALAGQDERCLHALELFAEIYGAEAANLALKFLAYGGLYVGGGIAPKILPILQRGGFMRAFLNKGRLYLVLERIPVHVCLNEEAALIGAAHLGESMLARVAAARP